MMVSTLADSLLKEALGYIASGDLTSTPLEGMLESDIANKDYESLWQHILQAREMLRDE